MPAGEISRLQLGNQILGTDPKERLLSGIHSSCQRNTWLAEGLQRLTNESLSSLADGLTPETTSSNGRLLRLALRADNESCRPQEIRMTRLGCCDPLLFV